MTVPEWKKKDVKEIEEMAQKPVVGIITLKGLPAAQFQEIRKDLREEADIKVSRKTLIKRAFENSGREGIKELEKHLEGPCGIISSEENPFKLYKSLEEKKSRSRAKVGKEVEEEVKVPEGPTSLQPGPILANLQKAGLPAQIKEGKIVINKDTVLLEPGDEITEEIAAALNTLDMKPLEIGIEPKALLEEGTVFTPDQLHIDVEETLQNLAAGHQQAINLSVESGYFTEESIEIMIPKAVQQAMNLSLEADIYNEETIEKKLGISESKAKALYSQIKQKGYE